MSENIHADQYHLQNCHLSLEIIYTIKKLRHNKAMSCIGHAVNIKTTLKMCEFTSLDAL